MKRLQTRMLLFILLPTILFFIGMIAFVTYTVHNMVIKDAEIILSAHGESLADELSKELERGLASVQTLSHAFQGVISKGWTPKRENANAMLQQLLANNPHLITSWMFWEPNAFDGQDEAYRNTPGHDHTGRFAPVWSQTGSGEFEVNPLVGYGTDEDVTRNLDYVLQTGESTIFEPYYYQIDGQDVMITSIAAPVIVNGKVLGMTGVDISLEALDQLVSQFTFYETGFAGLMSNEGNVISHQNTDLIGSNYFESEAMRDRADRELVKEAVRTGEQIAIEGFSNALQQNVYRLFTPMTISGIHTPWSAFLAAPIKEVTREANRLIIVIFSTSALVSIILAIIILYFSRDIAKPISEAVQLGEEMAKGDFSRHVPKQYLQRKDEIGGLAKIFAQITESMRQLIGEVQDSTNLVRQSATALDEGVNQASSAAHQVATSIEEVARAAESQMQSAEESAKSMEDMSQGVQRVAHAASTVAEATEDMNRRANLGQQTVEQAVRQMDRIQQETNQTRAVIQDLEEDASKIEQIVAMITEIAEQTNLLALNAAIEAARAGEAGKGFAVVAEEVRKLADETKTSAVDIERLVTTIQSSTLQATQSMATNVTEVEQGIEHMQEVGQVFQEIIGAVQDMVKEVEELSAISQEMSAVTEEIAAAAEEIASSAEVASGNTQQVAAAAEEQMATMEEMTRTSASLQTMANQLNELIKQFRI